MVHQRGLGEQFHRGGDGLDHGFDLALQIVALIDHVGDVGALPGLPFEVRNLVEDAEDLVGIDGAHGQIVVGIAAVVEVESASMFMSSSQATICSMFCAW